MNHRPLELVTEGRACLRCGHVRRAVDPGPDWACPACGVVYAKAEAAARQAAAAAAGEVEAQDRDDKRAWLEAKADVAEAEASVRERPDRQRVLAVYLLTLLPFGVTQALALTIALNHRQRLDDTWLGDHLRWVLRTHVYLALSAVPALLVGVWALINWTIFVVMRDGSRLEHAFRGGTVVLGLIGFGVVLYVGRMGWGWWRLAHREAP
jgi:predicted  nucleic acid-binding Zn-ribbon protein